MIAERGYGVRLSDEARAMNEAHRELREAQARRREFWRGCRTTAAIALAFVAFCLVARVAMAADLTEVTDGFVPVTIPETCTLTLIPDAPGTFRSDCTCDEMWESVAKFPGGDLGAWLHLYEIACGPLRFVKP